MCCDDAVGLVVCFCIAASFPSCVLLSVCIVLSGVFVGLILVWLVVGLGVLAIFLMSGFLANFVFSEE